jgi:hypothetical protein
MLQDFFNGYVVDHLRGEWLMKEQNSQKVLEFWGLYFFLCIITGSIKSKSTTKLQTPNNANMLILFQCK